MPCQRADAQVVTKPTRFQWLQIIALSVVIWLAIKLVIGWIAFGFLWGPG
jgi:hypothetical protein